MLTDGTGASEFVRELVKNYLYLAHHEDGLEDVVLSEYSESLFDQEADGFERYYADLPEPSVQPACFPAVLSLSGESHTDIPQSEIPSSIHHKSLPDASVLRPEFLPLSSAGFQARAGFREADALPVFSPF